MNEETILKILTLIEINKTQNKTIINLIDYTELLNNDVKLLFNFCVFLLIVSFFLYWRTNLNSK